MNQVEEDSLYHSLEEEAIGCLLVEPRSDQVSVSSVWCYEEDNIGKCIKTEDSSYNIGVPDSNINVEGVDTTKINALDVLPHEDGVENLLAANGISSCDDYLLDIGYIDHGSCIEYVSNEGFHVGNSSSETQFPMFNNKGSFGITGSECQNYFLGNIFNTSTTDSKTVNGFEDFSKSFIDQEDEEGNLPLQFAQTGMELVPFGQNLPQEHDVSAVTHKRSRKPTKRYIDESSNLTLKNCKKRKEASSMSKVKLSAVRRVKSQTEVKPKEIISSSEISFGKAIQVPFISQAPPECQKPSPPNTMENPIENCSSGSEQDDDSETMMRSMTGGSQRKLHRLWTVSEVKKLIDGVAHFGVGKWTHIKKLLFSSSVHRTPVDLKDKWRNLLKASRALKGGSRIEDEQKRSQPWRPLPKSILCRVRELASAYPYPRKGNPKISKSKFPLGRHVSFSGGIKGNKVPVL